MVEVAVSKDVAVTVVVETHDLVLRAERASTDCTVTASSAAMDSNFMMQRIPENKAP
jgi:hypothetical protein